MAARRPRKRQRAQAKKRGTARAAGATQARRGAGPRARARPGRKAASGVKRESGGKAASSVKRESGGKAASGVKRESGRKTTSGVKREPGATARPRASTRPERRSPSGAAVRETRPSRPRAVPTPEPVLEGLDALEPLAQRPAADPALTGGDLDADWQRAQDTGEEAVGGSVATPDQDVVDEIGRALGVEQEADREVWTSQDILGRRDRRYWRLERKAADEDEA